ncbi:hypothetical protein J2Z17_001977 [Rhizobium halophytocola]|uniref:Uncharacterized protein n=1 Tax=Rhizobium halophytocola TaxID=735519 RepID=A0ABS4DXY1_9HYPH|nr:hypothetical protein [Rhizobium halophytocola]
MSALGGWAAVTTALLTLVPVFLQLREMKRQTAFIVGDELPSVEILTNNDHAVYRFRIVNWNRRAFLINQIRWTNGPQIDLEPRLRTDKVTDEELKPDKHYEIQVDGRIEGWVPLEGWENRSRRPDAKFFWRYAMQDPDMTFSPASELPVMLEVTGTLAGDVQRSVVLRAEAPTLVDPQPKRGGPGPYTKPKRQRPRRIKFLKRV